MLIVQNHLICHKLDLLAITESWLTLDNGDEILRTVFPPGYFYIQKPRTGRRGGGLVLIHRCTIKCHMANFDLSATTFEYLATFLSIHSSCFLLLVIYRPPSSNLNLFISEFSTFFELLAIAPGKLIISGDFNIHVDKLCPVSTQFLSLIDSFDVQQHVCEHTHIHGHFLDLVLSRAHEKPIVDLFLSKLISDHFAVHWLVRAHRPSRPTKFSSGNSSQLTTVHSVLTSRTCHW